MRRGAVARQGQQKAGIGTLNRLVERKRGMISPFVRDRDLSEFEEMSIGPLIADGCQASVTSLPGHGPFRGRCLMMMFGPGASTCATACLFGHQPIDRSHRNHRPGGDIADPLGPTNS